tara:strand:+ start:2403 stop:3323 length:921 start_codon:yes stop_codon:yes gene_type:complete
MGQSVFNTSKAELSNSSPKDYILLLKPRVMSLAIFTALVGQLLALDSYNKHPLLVLISLLCIALGAGAAGCINMWYDRDIDALMKRTKNRPIPQAKVDAEEALTLGITLSIISVVLLTLASNYKAGILLLSSILFYVFIYTIWLKRKTFQNIVIGGAAGALPPIIGWATITNQVSLLPILLFLIIFFWTPPHFWALSLYTSADYKTAKIPMLPVVLGKSTTISYIKRYSYLLYVTSLLPFLFGFSGQIYLAFSVVLSSVFVFKAYMLKKNDDIKAKGLFRYSIFYLFLIFFILVIDKFVLLNFNFI